MTKLEFHGDDKIPTVTNEIVFTDSFPPDINLCMIDEVKEHRELYEKWLKKGVTDIRTQWMMITNKIFCSIILHDEGKDTLEFMTSFKLEQAQMLLNHPLHLLLICDKSAHLLFAVQMPVKELDKIIQFKKVMDDIKPILPEHAHKRLLEK